MKENQSNFESSTPILFPYPPEKFWDLMRQVIRDEVKFCEKEKTVSVNETPDLKHKPLFKIAEVFVLFQVTKPTIYDWIKHGKLKPYKVRSRVYFLRQDIEHLLHPKKQ